MRALSLSSVLIGLLLLPGSSFAQLRNQKMDVAQELRQRGPSDIISLIGLDPDKFSMSHSYSLSFSSFGGGYSTGLYLNTMKYRFSDPLTFYFQVGLEHHPFGNTIGNSTLQNRMFVSGAGLKYQPRDNLGLYLEFSQTPASSYYHNYPFRDPISRNPSLFEKQETAEEN